MLIYAQAESSQTLTDLCCKTGCTLSLEAWRARVTGWCRLVWFFSACGVAVIPSDAPDRFSILILSRSFYTIDELVVFCSANQAETFTDCWTTRAGSFSQSCLTSLWGGGEEKLKSHPEQTVLYLHHFQPAAAGNQLYTTCSAPNRHTERVQSATSSSFKRPMFSTQGVRNSDGWNMKKCRSAL